MEEKSVKIMAAERFRDKAEEKFKAGDTAAAKKYALKAKRLFPSLDGLTQMIAAFDVHIYAADKNWYGVLGIDNPTAAGTEIFKKQLKKMRLLTHPDKNRSAASVDAFRFVEEARKYIDRMSEKTPGPKVIVPPQAYTAPPYYGPSSSYPPCPAAGKNQCKSSVAADDPPPSHHRHPAARTYTYRPPAAASAAKPKVGNARSADLGSSEDAKVERRARRTRWDVDRPEECHSPQRPGGAQGDEGDSKRQRKG